MLLVVSLVAALSLLDCTFAATSHLLRVRPPTSARLGSRQFLQSVALGSGAVNSTTSSTQNSAIVPVALTSDQQSVHVQLLQRYRALAMCPTIEVGGCASTIWQCVTKLNILQKERGRQDVVLIDVEESNLSKLECP